MPILVNYLYRYRLTSWLLRENLKLTSKNLQKLEFLENAIFTQRKLKLSTSPSPPPKKKMQGSTEVYTNKEITEFYERKVSLSDLEVCAFRVDIDKIILPVFNRFLVQFLTI